jgi:hypothetical protein
MESAGGRFGTRTAQEDLHNEDTEKQSIEDDAD